MHQSRSSNDLVSCRQRASARLRSLSLFAGAGLLYLMALVACSSANAQPTAPVARFYTPGDLMRSVHRDWYAPKASAFATQAAALPAALSAICDSTGTSDVPLAKARDQYKATAFAWDVLSGVQIGPLVQRRSARQIDFMPTRPELIKSAIQAAPQDALAMQSVGTPAKGLPALEWLLWKQPVEPATPACRYAVQVAADVQREADALAQAFTALASQKPGDNEAANVPAVSELLNQWTGALERLRWTEMEKPREAGATATAAAPGGRNAPAYSRTASGLTAQRWAAQWQALRTLSVGPAAGQGAASTDLVSLDSYMRGLGRDEPAQALATAVAAADKAMQKVSPANPAAISGAARALANVKAVTESKVAPAMEVSIGFSDSDGD